jgi:hypothetical protein
MSDENVELAYRVTEANNQGTETATDPSPAVVAPCGDFN